MKEKSSKLVAAASALSTFNVGLSMYQDYRDRWYARRTYTASVPEDAFVFRPLLSWVNDSVDTRAVRFFSTSSKVERLYDSEGRTSVNIKGFDMNVMLKKPSFEFDDMSKLDITTSNPFSKSLVFSSVQPAAIDALQEFLEEITEAESRREREIWVYRPGTYGWNANEFTYRDIDSIFLPGQDKEELVADLSNFLEKEDRYHKMGIPWHRGYLLYGPPGNGKSSLTAALAHAYGLNLYNMPLSVVKDDKQLSDLISGIEDNSLLLFEDIDIFSQSVTRERESGDTGPTLAGLLNALDGVSTPNGLITFMNTNEPDVLDSALVRPGRVDFKLELKPPVASQISSMFERVYDEPLGGEPRAFSSMAALAEVFKRHPDDVNIARTEVLTTP